MCIVPGPLLPVATDFGSKLSVVLDGIREGVGVGTGFSAAGGRGCLFVIES